LADTTIRTGHRLYLHHLALGERDTADFWHRQTDDVQPPPGGDPVVADVVDWPHMLRGMHPHLLHRDYHAPVLEVAAA
jgi:hypothetical protein